MSVKPNDLVNFYKNEQFAYMTQAQTNYLRLNTLQIIT